MTEAGLQVLSVLRRPDNFQWYVVPLLGMVGYIYLNEIERGNWSAVWLGISLWAFELIWEMVNGMILTFTEVAPLWCIPGSSAFVIYAGLNVEIAVFFAIGGLLLIKSLPGDKNIKLFGIPNRIFIPAAGALLAVVCEVALYKWGILAWHWWFWKWPHLYIIFINYLGPSLGLVWLHDNLRNRSKRKVAALLTAAAIICHLVFATALGWA